VPLRDPMPVLMGGAARRRILRRHPRLAHPGHYGSVKLDSLNVAMLGSFRGNVWNNGSDFKEAIVLDERADEAQRAALQTVFQRPGRWLAQALR
jgi:hypothetical protein